MNIHKPCIFFFAHTFFRQDFWLPPLQVKKKNEGRDIMSQGHLGCHIGN